MNDNKENNFFPLMDMNNKSDGSKNKLEQLNIPNYSFSTQKITNTTVDEEDQGYQSQDKDNLLDMNDSGIIQIPDNKSDDKKNSISSNRIENDDTLDESIYSTIIRDLTLIYNKLKNVVNPFLSQSEKRIHIIQWDLWGPLLFLTFLSGILTIKSQDKGNIIISIFTIFSIGSILVYVNAHLINQKIKFFQTICLLGYCLFPMNLSALILAITNFYEIFRIFIVALCCTWSLFSIKEYFKSLCTEEQNLLVFYPAVLLYLFISWFIFVTK